MQLKSQEIEIQKSIGLLRDEHERNKLLVGLSEDEAQALKTSLEQIVGKSKDSFSKSIVIGVTGNAAFAALGFIFGFVTPFVLRALGIPEFYIK